MTGELYEKKAGNGCVAELLLEGRMTRGQLGFLAGSVKKYKINKTTLNRRGNVVAWNLRREALADFLSEAEQAGIAYKSAYIPEKINVLCAPLSGIEEGECFDVYPYAEAARRWLGEQRARQEAVEAQSFDSPFAVCFSNVPRPLAEGKACDMVFCAVEGGLFEVWAREPEKVKPEWNVSGQEPKKAAESGEVLFRLAEKVEAGRFLSYVKVGLAVRGQAADSDGYRSLFWQALAALPDQERRPVPVETAETTKTGNGNFTCGPRVVKQKQEELYAVRYHPLGGVVPVAFWQKLLRSVEKIEGVEFRLDFQMNFYVCNLLAEEVGLPMDCMADGAFTAAEASPVQTFCGLCPKAHCDAQMFGHVFLKETKKLGFADGVLPTFTVAGCRAACGDISDVELRFLAEIGQTEENKEAEAVKVVQGKRQEKAGKSDNTKAVKTEKTGETAEPVPVGSRLWFTVESRGDSGDWHPMGRISQQKLTEYLIALGALPQSAGLSFQEWKAANPGLLEKVTALYAVPQ